MAFPGAGDYALISIRLAFYYIRIVICSARNGMNNLFLPGIPPDYFPDLGQTNRFF